MESWLADMAEDGLFLVSFGTYFAHFESRPPQKAAYRLEPASSLYLTPDEKKLEILDEFGWEYVASVDKYFHVFRAKTEFPAVICGMAEGRAVFQQILYFTQTEEMADA